VAYFPRSFACCSPHEINSSFRKLYTVPSPEKSWFWKGRLKVTCLSKKSSIQTSCDPPIVEAHVSDELQPSLDCQIAIQCGIRTETCLWCPWKCHVSNEKGLTFLLHFLSVSCRTIKMDPKIMQFDLFSSVFFMQNHVLNYLIFYEAGILLLLAHLVRPLTWKVHMKIFFRKFQTGCVGLY
jgi:hypothetical protein